MSVCCECCVLSGRGLCDELITSPEESYRPWCVVVCDLETSKMRRPRPTMGLSRQQKKNSKYSKHLMKPEGSVSLLIKRYNLFKVLACPTTFFHLSLFCATFFQLRTFMLFILLTLRLLMSYIYGAPSKARNANVVYIRTYVWQR